MSASTRRVPRVLAVLRQDRTAAVIERDSLDHSSFSTMYSLSTCWNSHRHTDGRAMLREIRELGFEYVELGHGTRISLVPGILEAIDAGEMKVSSVHNFCPLPMGVNHAAPNLYQFSAERQRERELAERHTRKTFEFATRVGAKAVVLHLGSIDMKDYTDKLLEMVGRDGRETPRYERLCAEVDEKRESLKEPFFERVKETLRSLLPDAESRGLRLGAENRESIDELPLESDFQFLFREIKSPALGYWHDTGHAQIKENIGFINHLMHLESLQDRLVGFHIHDVQFPGRDHCTPGSGSIDFAALKPILKPHHIKVFELSPGLTAEDVRKGVEHIQSIWGKEG
jgi:sugar phosphate isomerase/epimerase